MTLCGHISVVLIHQKSSKAEHDGHPALEIREVNRVSKTMPKFRDKEEKYMNRWIYWGYNKKF